MPWRGIGRTAWQRAIVEQLRKTEDGGGNGVEA
jgi:hypothetical protein